jgi:hypothetical protein
MSNLVPYGLPKTWSAPSNRAPGGLCGLKRCLGRSGAWAGYQLQKLLGLFPAEGRVILWADGLRVHLLSSSQLSQACLYYGLGGLALDAISAPLPAARRSLRRYRRQRGHLKPAAGSPCEARQRAFL